MTKIKTNFFAGAMLLALLTLTAYLPAMSGGFSWDDETMSRTT